MSWSPHIVDDVIDLTADNNVDPFATPLRHSEPPLCVWAASTQKRPSFARPWWYRMPHFVPAAAIEFDAEKGRGINPRTGETVYVDYLNQFQTDTASLAAVKQPTRPNEKQRHEMPAAIKGRLSEGDFRVGWTTNADGKTVFKTKDGKEYVGMKAYEMNKIIKMADAESQRRREDVITL